MANKMAVYLRCFVAFIFKEIKFKIKEHETKEKAVYRMIIGEMI